jgi:2-iminobutanoate/2-iminopropanoate deaminase
MREDVKTESAPKAIGPYSQAIKAGDLVFVSGQIPLDPETATVVAGSIREQTERTLTNLGAVLTAAGSSLGSVLKTTVYLADMGEFTEMNEVYATFFSDTPPARSTVEVSRLPRDVRVEIDAIALIQ